MTLPRSAALGTGALYAYAAPAVPLSMLLFQVIIYIPTLYAAEGGLSIAAVGVAFFLVRLFDAFIDVGVGRLSDRTRSRWGRRKPWMLIGMPLLVGTTWLLGVPPAGAGIGYLMAAALSFYATFSMVMIPFMSWGGELSRDYAQRTRINAIREGGSIIGLIAGTVLPIIVLRKAEPSLHEISFVFVVAVMVMLPIATVLALRRTPQGAFFESAPQSLWKALGAARRNKPLCRLLLGVLFMLLGFSVFNALAIFMVNQTLKMPNSAMLWFILSMYLASFAAVPMTVKLADRFGRHRVLVGTTAASLAALPLFIAVPNGAFVPALLLFVFLGLCTTASYVLPPALVSDAIDYGVLKGANDDAALYMGLYHFVQKVGTAGGVGIALPLAGLLGFHADGANTAHGLHALDEVALVLPFFVALPGVWMLFDYPLTRARHDVVARCLKRRTEKAVPA